MIEKLVIRNFSDKTQKRKKLDSVSAVSQVSVLTIA